MFSPSPPSPDAPSPAAFPSPSTPTLPSPIRVLFVSTFHPTRGNELSFTHVAPSDDGTPEPDLKNLEFSSLPSGAHLLSSDEVWFSHSAGNSELQGLAVFRRVPSDSPASRGAHMFSVGILLPSSSSYDVDPASFLPILETLSLHLLSSSPSPDILSLLPSSAPPATPLPPSIALPQALDILGPLWLPVHRLLLAREKVLVYWKVDEQHGVGWASTLVRALMEAVRDEEGEVEGRTRCLWNVGLTDMDRLAKLEGGWIATTTDALYLERPSLYGALLTLTPTSPNPTTPTLHLSVPSPSPSSSPSQTLQRDSPTLPDLLHWRRIRALADGEDERDALRGWWELLALVWALVFGRGPDIRVHLPRPPSENGAEGEDEDAHALLRPAPAPAEGILAYLRAYTNALLAVLLSFALRPSPSSPPSSRPTSPTFSHPTEPSESESLVPPPTRLSGRDVLALGLSPLSDLDLRVLRRLAREELGKEVRVRLGWGWGLARGVRRWFVGRGWGA